VVCKRSLQGADLLQRNFQWRERSEYQYHSITSMLRAPHEVVENKGLKSHWTLQSHERICSHLSKYSKMNFPLLMLWGNACLPKKKTKWRMRKKKKVGNACLSFIEIKMEVFFFFKGKNGGILLK